jgi:hypothetical protein
MNEVDYIGKKSVAEAIRLSKLTKFIIFQQGATKGSTPVYRCTEAKTIEKAQRSFEDWADSILRVNQNNNRAYEILLYSARTSEADIEDDTEEKKGTKTDKIRFSFSLNPYNNMMNGFGGGGGGSIAEQIAKGIEDYKKDERLNRLEAELRDLRENGNGQDDDEDEHENALDKVARLITLVRKGDFKKVAGDDDIPDPDDDEDADTIEADEEEEKKPKSDPKKDQRVARLKIALQRIKKCDPEWKGLYKMSELAKKNPTMFDSYMQTLMKMKF